MSVLALAWGCDGPAAEPADAGPPQFIAIERDFADFRSWERIPIDATALPTGMSGASAAIYVWRRAPEDATRWPVGSMFVKAIEEGPPSEWILHAMAKRGIPFNGSGTLGWEFFELSIDGADVPRILWRGEGPMSGHGYGAMQPDGGVIELVCNDCHAPAWQDDGVLTPQLSLN